MRNISTLLTLLCLAQIKPDFDIFSVTLRGSYS